MAAGTANTATAAISSGINDLCRNRMKVEDVQERVTLEASRRRQAESNRDAGVGSTCEASTPFDKLGACPEPPEGACFARQLYPRADGSSLLGLFPGGFWPLVFFPRLFLRSLRRHHLIRLPNQPPQLIPPERIQSVQHHPLIAPHIRRRMNVLTLDQLGKNLRRTLETKPRIVQANNRKDL